MILALLFTVVGLALVAATAIAERVSPDPDLTEPAECPRCGSRFCDLKHARFASWKAR